MFTGIIETFGSVVDIKSEGTNVHFTLSSSFTSELKIDQSVAHNGVCLTVVAIDGDKYVVTAIDETMVRSNLSSWKIGDRVNLERCVKVGSRLDGHIVQGHVDTTGEVLSIDEVDGSWVFRFRQETGHSYLVEKGSITINGVSLTVVECFEDGFSVAIIPYTYDHTNFGDFKIGTKVNLEFDVVGKYVERMLKNRF